MNFRLKLLLAMMLAVAGVSGATLFITQRKVQAAYEKVFKETLEAQITYLPREQEARLASAMERCGDLVRNNVRLIAAMSDGDTNTLYRVARDELQRILRTGEGPGAPDAFELPPEPPPAAAPSRNDPRRKPAASPSTKGWELRGKAMVRSVPAPSRQRQAMFLSFLDGEGKVLPDPAWTASSAFTRHQFSRLLARVGASVGTLTNQHVGYSDLPDQGRSNLLLELIATPIVDETENKTVGVLLLGFPFLDLGERTINEVSDIHNGIFLDGKLHSHTIPDPARKALLRLLPEEIAANPSPREDFVLPVGGIPHRVYYTPLNPESPFGVAWKVGLYSWESALRAQRELRTQIIGFGAFGLLAALFISLLLSHGLAVPIRELVGGTTEIRRGNFGVKVLVRSDDELGQLARSFNEMADGLALKERYHDLLVKVTDKDVAAQLLSGEVMLGGELREVSILFCDIRGFTAMTQNMGPAEVIAMLNHHMTAMTRIVNEHHGVVDKFIGDSVMALFGAPKSYGNDALNAALCAAAMQLERAALNQIVPRKLHLGIGIASGPVLAGNMGSASRSNYTVIGERVNLAARLCSIAGRDETVISQFTREELGDLVTVEEKEQLRLKGFDASVTAFRLLTVRERELPVPAMQEVKA